MKVLIAQFSSIKPNSREFNKYINSAFKGQQIDLIVLGEYVCTRFFKEYKKSDKVALAKLFSAYKQYFSTVSKKHQTSIIAPVIEVNEKGIFKSAIIARMGEIEIYQTQKLMSMHHWNERAFFANQTKPRDPLIFSIGGFRTSVLFGWESHFDELWIRLRKKNVDVVIVPTACTFNSHARWARLLQTRSFLNNCYIVRVNRVGSYVENNIEWKFYGNSFVSLPNGNISDILGDKSGILISDIRQSVIEEALHDWEFR